MVSGRFPTAAGWTQLRDPYGDERFETATHNSVMDTVGAPADPSGDPPEGEEDSGRGMAVAFVGGQRAWCRQLSVVGRVARPELAGIGRVSLAPVGLHLTAGRGRVR